LDEDGAGGGCGHAGAVGGHVVDGVGGHAARVEDDVGHEGAVEERLDAEVEVGLRAGDGGTEVGVAVADMDDRRVFTLIWMMGGVPGVVEAAPFCVTDPEVLEVVAGPG